MICLSVIALNALLAAGPNSAAAATNSNARCFATVGQVVIPPYAANLSFILEINGQCQTFWDRRDKRDVQVEVGDFVRIVASAEKSRRNERIIKNCRQLAVLGHGRLQEPPPVTLRDFLSGEYTGKRVCMRGTVVDVLPDDIDSQFVNIVLSDGSDMVYIYYSDDQRRVSAMRPLFIGREIVVTGVGQKNMGTRRFTGPAMEISGTNAVRAVTKSPGDPFDIPLSSNTREFNVKELTGGLRKFRGTVVATWNGDSFLMKTRDDRTVEVDTVEKTLPHPGEVIEAVGHLETDLIDLRLSRAFWRTAAADEPPSADERPVDIKLSDLFTNMTGKAITDTSQQGRTFRVSGIVKNISTDKRGFRHMLVADGGHSIHVDCSTVQSALSKIDENYLVEVSGVCVKDSDIWRPNVPLPKVRGIFLALRDAHDLRVLAKPSWWTSRRIMTVFGLLLPVIVAVLIWNATLRALVIRKSRALLKEQAQKLSETLKIGERTRLAADLHDFHSQNLTAISYQISAARNACMSDPAEAERLLATASHMLKSCRTDLRRCLWDLRNNILNEPNLEKAILDTISPVAGSAKLSIRFAGRRVQISDSTTHTMLSILRELTANAVNHGHASSIRIAGECRPQTLSFSIEDNGCGFDPENRPGQDHGHFGLDGIRQRLVRIGGSIKISTAPGHGCYIRIAINHSATPPQL